MQSHTPSAPARLPLSALIWLSAAVLGILASALLQTLPWGLNLTIFLLACLGAIGVGWRLGAVRLTGAGRYLIPIFAALALAYVTHDAYPLAALDLLAIAVVGALMIDRTRTGRLRVAGWSQYLTVCLAALLSACQGAMLARPALADGRANPAARAARVLLRVAVGTAIALPMLIVFASLFGSADPRFGAFLRDVFRLDRWNLGQFVRDGVIAFVAAWGTLGLLAHFFGDVRPHAIHIDSQRDPTFPTPLGAVEALVALGLFNLLFGAFVVFQLPYLFSATPIGQTPGLNPYADYARRGFLELVAVAAFTLPTLLTGDWITRTPRPKLYTILSLTLLGLLAVIAASALQRMWLYTQAYGLTELRLYSTTFMLWLAAVFAWYVPTVLRCRRDRFAFGALVAALGTLLALYVVNPDDLIVRANLDLSRRAGSTITLLPPGNRVYESNFDDTYALTLSADAAPALIDALPSLPQAQACQIANALRRKAREVWAVGDWRSWSLARALATERVRTMTFTCER